MEQTLHLKDNLYGLCDKVLPIIPTRSVVKSVNECIESDINVLDFPIKPNINFNMIKNVLISILPINTLFVFLIISPSLFCFFIIII